MPKNPWLGTPNYIKGMAARHSADCDALNGYVLGNGLRLKQAGFDLNGWAVYYGRWVAWYATKGAARVPYLFSVQDGTELQLYRTEFMPFSDAAKALGGPTPGPWTEGTQDPVGEVTTLGTVGAIALVGALWLISKIGERLTK